MECYSKQKRILAFLLSICLVAIITCSMVFIVTHINHNCSGEDCPICAEIQVAEAVIHRFSTAVAVLICCGAAFATISHIDSHFQCFIQANTLINKKVRMDD